jgi:hypothetical protein
MTTALALATTRPRLDLDGVQKKRFTVNENDYELRDRIRRQVARESELKPDRIMIMLFLLGLVFFVLFLTV